MLDHRRQEPAEVAQPIDGPAVFWACHGAIRHMLMEAMPVVNMDCTEEGRRWDELVPAGLVEGIVEGVAAGGGSYTCDVRMHVEVTRVYSEAEELLFLCEAVAGVRLCSCGRRRGVPDLHGGAG
jgi:hypothetical protein